MDEQRIEALLRKAPAPKTPDGLLRELLTDVRVPRGLVPSASRMEWTAPVPLWKRWLPALSFAVILLTCLVAIAVQTNVINDLTRQNNDLRASAQTLEDLRKENTDLQQVRNDGDELERLRKDAAELAKLRGEVAQMSAQLRDIEKLRADNQQLKADITARQAAAGMGDESVLNEAREKAKSQACMNNMKQIGLAFRIWADDNNGVFPTSFLSMTNELATSRVLQCPSDKNVKNVPNIIQAITGGDVSYKLMSAVSGLTQSDPSIVLVQCPIHGHICLADGSVQAGTPELQQKLKTINGAIHLMR